MDKATPQAVTVDWETRRSDGGQLGRARRAMTRRTELEGWSDLRHGGLLLDAQRQSEMAALAAPSAPERWLQSELRRRSDLLRDVDTIADSAQQRRETSDFIAFVLERLCGFAPDRGSWLRGSRVPGAWSRRSATGESVRPRQLWLGPNGAVLPVFVTRDRRVGIGRGRRETSRVLGWLRAGAERLALVTNGRQWRLLFAGLDFEAWCEWDVDLWFADGAPTPALTAMLTLIRPTLWIPEADGVDPPLLRAVRDSRKGQADLSEALGERVREAVELLIQAHGEALKQDCANVAPADIYRAACRVVMRLVVILFAEARGLLPRDDAVYDAGYGLGGLHEALRRRAAKGRLQPHSHGAWPRLLALFNLVREGSHHPDLPVPAYGGDLFAPGSPDAADGLSRALAAFETACLRAEVLSDAQVHELLERLTRTRVRVLQGKASSWVSAPVDFSDLSTEYIGVLYEGLLDYELKTAPDDDPVIFLAVGEQPALPLARLEAMDDRALRSLFTAFKDKKKDRNDKDQEEAADSDDGEASDDPNDDLDDKPAATAGSTASQDAATLAARTLRSASTARLEDGGSSRPGGGGGGSGTRSGEHDPSPDTAVSSFDGWGTVAAREQAGDGVGYEHVRDARQTTRTRAEKWARRAALAAGLVRIGKKIRKTGRSTSKTGVVSAHEANKAHEHELARQAASLVSRVVLPGEWYLVRWGGTRKGSGSFYTRPGLAVLTVQRTLRPLAYDPPAGADGGPDRDAPPGEWIPRRPEEILDLKVCDPACGSGSFPLAALRFLTDALYASLQHHRRIENRESRALVRLLGLNRRADRNERSQASDDPETPQRESEAIEGAGASNGRDTRNTQDARDAVEYPGDELIPCPPDADEFESRLKAVLRRYVVERCIYGVDLDPLAVSLCQLSLWIETMDRNLPFSFLDHKIRCGNSLIGAWFDSFQHYPVMAWKNREGGDRNHGNGVHYRKGARTRAIKAFVKDDLTPDLRHMLEGRTLFHEDLLEQAAETHRAALESLERMHRLPIQDAASRARLYREELLGSSAWRSLKQAMDLWCACWFWPADELDCAPLPTTFADPSPETRAAADRIAAEMRFFHWELEFPDVFREPGSGFDAILGNPPWETLQPSSKEYFSNLDPLYRTYGRQEALRWQIVYYERSDIERGWLLYNGRYESFSNWMKYAAKPFGDPVCTDGSAGRFAIARGGRNIHLHERWRQSRDRAIGFSDPKHPFRHRGKGKAFTYKLFLEQSHALLADGGRLGLVVPSGLYSDLGARALRDLFLERCTWEWLFGFENRAKLFPIDSRFKFNPVIVQKGGATEAIYSVFMRRDLTDWERAEDLAVPYSRELVFRFSPKTLAILEIESPRDLEVVEKIYANSVLLGDKGPDGWGIRYAQGDFNMTNDSMLFPPKPDWEARGYRPDEYSRWLLGNWRPLEELWTDPDLIAHLSDTPGVLGIRGVLGFDPDHPEPAAVSLEDWLFDCDAGPERRRAERAFIHGHLLAPGDVEATGWRTRCARPPYDRLPVPRAAIPEGIILSREADAWVRETEIEDVALPLYEGRMIGQFDSSQKGWVSGKGRGAVWRDIPWERKQIEPQYLMAEEEYRRGVPEHDAPKLLHMNIASGTNRRTAVGAYVQGAPSGHSAGVLYASSAAAVMVLTCLMDSFAFDAVTRCRLVGLHFDYHVVEQNPVPRPSLDYEALLRLGTSLMLTTPRESTIRLLLGEGDSMSRGNRSAPLRWQRAALARPALTAPERLRRRAVLDALVAAFYGLDESDYRRLLADSDHPCSIAASRLSSQLRGKAFWRVDKDKAPELRHTVLTQIAFAELQRHIEANGGDRDAGIRTFMDQNHGEGWLLPENLRLADHGLGHDDRAREHQPVAAELGARFWDWQLAQPPEEAEAETRLHARNLLGEHRYRRLLADLEQRRPDRPEPALPPDSQVAEPRHRWDDWLDGATDDPKSRKPNDAKDTKDTKDAGQTDLFD